MYLRNHEPSLKELRDDPITRLLMARDGLHPEVAWEAVEDARRKLDARVERHLVGLVVSEANASVLFRPHQVWTKMSVTPDGADLRVSVARGD
jgi:hypothetical protein